MPPISPTNPSAMLQTLRSYLDAMSGAQIQGYAYEACSQLSQDVNVMKAKLDMLQLPQAAAAIQAMSPAQQEALWPQVYEVLAAGCREINAPPILRGQLIAQDDQVQLKEELISIIMRMAGKDPLKRAWNPEATTYWEDPEEQPAELERYFNQF